MVDVQTDDDTPNSFDSPESSTVLGGHYDPEAQRLVVVFRRQAGQQEQYQFDGVSAATWREFYQAQSKGNYFSRFIRPMHSGKKLGHPARG